MTHLQDQALPVGELERRNKVRRKNRILVIIIGAFALAMIILSYLMFSHYRFVPYE